MRGIKGFGLETPDTKSSKSLMLSETDFRRLIGPWGLPKMVLKFGQLARLNSKSTYQARLQMIERLSINDSSAEI